jgi:organic radical activating enzyme
MKLTYQDINKENWFLISWTLTNKCNYRCSYCPDILHNGTTGYPAWETVKNFVENFKIKNKNICYRLSGGEPTYWKHFIDLAKMVYDQGHTFSFLTNGSRPVEYFKEIGKYTKGIILSYHPEYSNKSHFVNIANSIDSAVIVNLMIDPNKFNDTVEIAKYLFDKSKNLSIWPKIILNKTDQNKDFNSTYEYSEEQFDLIKEWPYFRSVDDYNLHRGNLLYNDQLITANELIIQEKNKHKGWKCWAGLHMINIDMWGDIYRADCQQGGKIGNLSNFTLPTEPITCQKTLCSCLSDIYLKKEK